MANTGQRTVLTLRQRNITTDTLTGVTKPNLPGDPDYIPPSEDFDACPVVFSEDCPTVSAAAAGADAIFFEFSLPDTVKVNPALVRVDVLLRSADDDSLIDTMSFTDFDPNYLSGTFTGLAGGDYYLDIEYIGEEDVLIKTCEDVSDVTLDSVVTWEPIDEFCVTSGACETGDYDSETNTCQVTDEVPATPPSEPGQVAWHVSNNQWNNGGGQIFDPGYDGGGNGSIAAILTTPHFWANGNFPWDIVGRNTTDSRFNAAGIWVSPETVNPVGEWIGFVRRIDVAVAKTVYVAITADNLFRFSLNSVMLVNCTTGLINASNAFNYMNIYPVDLEPGANYIEMWAQNTGSVAGMAMEIYDQSLASLMAATSLGDLNIIFTTADLFGEPFDLGTTVGWSCPADHSLDTSGPGDPVCIQITTTPATPFNNGQKAFENRRRLNNGIPDGYIEPNTDGGGLGPYFPPVTDTDACPTEGIFSDEFDDPFA